MPVLVRSDDGVGVRASHRSFDLFLVTAVMSLTSILIYLVRMIQRLYDGRKLGWDDLAITISLVRQRTWLQRRQGLKTLLLPHHTQVQTADDTSSSILCLALPAFSVGDSRLDTENPSVNLGLTIMIGVKYGYGLHQLQLGGYDEFVARLVSCPSAAADVILWQAGTDMTSKTFYLEQIFYKGSLNCTKLSMLFMYLRVFPYRRFRKVSETMIWIIAIYAWASIIVTIVQCVPLAKIFDHSVEGGCINVTSFWLANANFNLLSDLIILIMPIPLILGLQVARSPKFGLYIIFGLGFL